MNEQAVIDLLPLAAAIVAKKKAKTSERSAPIWWLPDNSRGDSPPPTPRPESESTIKPQPGPQSEFHSSSADIVFYGGAAGGGKTFSIAMEALRHIDNPDFGAVIFRRTCPQITNEGSLWDTSQQIYRKVGARDRETDLDWMFPSGASVSFGHMEYEKNRFNWDSSQICYLGFDQVEQFTKRQFFYMLSRNRSTCGVRPFIRAGCNPPTYTEPKHWLLEFLAWWIDEKTGYAIPERSGVVRWFVVVDDRPEWADSREELIDRFGEDCNPLSCTFIEARLEDNVILNRQDPAYRAKLMAMAKVDRDRLLRANWHVAETTGTFFQRHWFEIVDATPTQEDEIRYWDRAASDNNPLGSWTAGVRMGNDTRGVFYIIDVARFQGTPLTVKTGIKNTTTQDGHDVRVKFEQDPGQAGKAEAQDQVRSLAGYIAGTNTVRESKGKRALGLSAQAEAGNVKLVRGPWNDVFLAELENFDGSDKCMADQVDAASGAFYCLTNVKRAGAWGR